MYRQLKIKKGRERSLRNRHPWIFSGAAAYVPDCGNGEIVEVVTFADEILGYGFFSRDSQIICRMFEFTASRVESFENAYFNEKIERAADFRKKIIGNGTDCYRLINAEGDFFPGLTADVYGDVVVLQIMVKGTELLLDVIADSLVNMGHRNICVKNPGVNEVEKVDLPFSYIRGAGGNEIDIVENGLKFAVDPEHGQKTGFFLDQRENRNLLKGLSGGKKILNAFCYTGGFSVYAVAGGAEIVHSVDISADAVEMASKNIEVNFGNIDNHKAIKADCFEYLRKMKDDFYDIIILDPPAFVKSSHGVEKGARGYKDINLNAMKKIKKGSLLFTFSCSHHVDAALFRKIVFGAAADSGKNARIVAQLSQGKDHPFSIYHPEGEYLKGLLLYIE